LIVLDSSAVIDWLLQTAAGLRIRSRIRSESVHAPHLLDIEVAQVLRRLVRGGVLPAWNADEAIEIFRDLQIVRYPHVTFLPRIWQYRHTLSAYDALYVVLAETLDATLITRDARLAAAHSHSAKIELF
jgi:predicted nucleic acid-binding protein